MAESFNDNDTKTEKVNIWYRPISQADYPKIAQIGKVVIKIRILPGISNGNMYEAIFEKDTSTSLYPNTKKWIMPVLVVNDPLHPDKRGFVGVMDVSKTLYRAITKNPPANFFDLNHGFNFNIVVELQKSKDGKQIFPNYTQSAFDTTPTSVRPDYVIERMNVGKFTDFADFTKKLNEYFLKKANGGGEQQVSAFPQSTIPASTYTSGPVQTQKIAQTNPVPQNAEPFPWEAPQSVPAQTSDPAPQTVSPDEFDSIFGTPNK